MKCDHVDDYKAGCSKCRADFKSAYLSGEDPVYAEAELTDERIDDLIGPELS